MDFVRRIPTLAWVFVVTAVVLGIGVWFFTRPSVLGTKNPEDELSLVPVSSPVEGTVEYTVSGRQHIAAGTSIGDYNSNPPNSGNHWPAPAGNGVFDKEIPDEQLVHNLEHGHVWISYRLASVDLEDSTSSADQKPGLSEDEVNKLKEIVKADDWKVVLTPRAKNDSPIALVAWGRVLKMDQIDENKIKDFIKTYRNRGPEKTPE